MLDRIVNKLTSGRTIFTVITAVILYHGALEKLFAPEKVLEIIQMVVIFYFVVKQQQGGAK